MMTGQMYDRLVTRLEKAGAELSAASSLLAGTGGDLIPLGDAIRRVNLITADLRRAVIRIETGEEPGAVMEEYRRRWLEDARS